MATKKVRLSDLVEDMTLYPRHDVNSTNITAIADALEVGASVPPIVVEDKTLRIVDGIHRTRAYLRVHDPSYKVTVETRSYVDDTELFEDAARLNRVHGQKLQQRDLTKVALRLHEADRDAEQIAAVLSVPISKVEKILGHIVIVGDDGDSDGQPEAAKPAWWPTPQNPPRHFTTEQASVARSSNGWRTGQTVRQLIKELTAGLHDEVDEDLRGAFLELANAISERFEA